MQNKFSIYNLLLTRLSRKKSGWTRPKRVTWPKRIGSYRFVKPVLEDRVLAAFFFAEYQDDHGNIARAKYWTGTQKTFDYYSLQNEIAIYGEFKKLYDYHGDEIRTSYPDIYIPKFVGTRETSDSLIMLVEKVQGTDLGVRTLNERIKTYEELLAYFRYIESNYGAEFAKVLEERTPLTTIIVNTVATIRAMARYPRHFFLFLQALYVFAKCMSDLMHSRYEQAFVHRSLEDHNIIVNGDRINLIDFQLSVRAHPMLDIVQLLLFSWDDQQFCRSVLATDLLAPLRENVHDLNVYKAYAIYNAMHQLATSGEWYYERNLSYLKHAISIDHDGMMKYYNQYASVSQTQKLISVTVGIPAHNEEANIANMLRSVISQRGNFHLDKIIVAFDGCNDRTEEIVSAFMQSEPRVEIICDHQRRGKVSRLNEIYQKMDSDVLVTLDADIAPASESMIEQMIKHFRSSDRVVVAGNGLPYSPETFAQRIINRWYMLWFQIRNNFRHGDTIHNMHGNATAISRSMAKAIVYPPEIVADENFMYLSAKKMGYTFIYEKSALFYLRTPDNFGEFFIQTFRFHTERDALETYFGKDICKEYIIPTPYKFAQVIFTTLRHPVYTILAFGMFAYFKYFYRRRDPLTKRGMWEVIKSSKKPIYLQTFQEIPTDMKPTVSVGLSIHNEELNIKRLLQQIVAQNTDTFILEHVYVNNDGSNDATLDEVGVVQKDNPEIILMNDGERKGKATRLQEMYRKNKSDYLVIFDGDIKLGNDFILEELIKPFTNPEVVIVGTNSIPAPAMTMTEKLINVWTSVWYEVRSYYKGGSNIHSLAGCGMALRGDFARSISFVPGIISEAPYIYLTAMKKNKKFVLADRALVFFASPETMDDFIKQRSRASNELDLFVKEFGDIVERESYVPRSIKIMGGLRGLAKYNVLFICALMFHQIAMMKVKKRKRTARNGIWERVTSTKRTLAAAEVTYLAHKLYHVVHIIVHHSRMG